MTAQRERRQITPDPDTTLVLSRDFEAERDLVFGALLDANVLQTIWSVKPWTIVEITVDPRVGGHWKLTMRDETTGALVRCMARYMEIEKPHRIVWRSKWLDGPLADADEMRITLEFISVAGGTRLTVTHELFPDRKARDDQGERWAAELSLLGRMFGDTFSKRS
jgi:uncharacterized protein YndB with AHSA1/START domain